MGRGGDRAAAARRAGAERMHRAAAHLREGAVVNDEPAARRATADLLEHLADQELAPAGAPTSLTRGAGLEVHTFDRAAALADRILAGDPAHALDDVRPLPPGFTNGTHPRRG